MMQQKERLEKQLDFIREIDKEKEIFRQTYLADASGACLAYGYHDHALERVCQ